MTVIVRFAPSPTGRLHIGNLRPALLNWLFARRQGGKFLLRIDDTDRERSRGDLADAIRTDLAWLGLDWDLTARQSDCFDRYAEVIGQLKAAGRIYPCFETADELDRRRKRQMAMGRPPVYDRAALMLTAQERGKLEAEGRRPYWRFKLSDGKVSTWDDAIRGPQHVDLASQSDPVVLKEDGSYLYSFCSVVDDIDFAITHVIRGEDHVTNTGVQIDMFGALGATPPVFGHHSLLVDADGEALSKRLGSLSLSSFREAGFEPMAVTSYVAAIGTSDPVLPVASMAELAKRFDLAKLSRAPARFDEKELADLNAKLLHGLAFGDVAEKLEAVCPGADERLWNAVRGNLRVLADIAQWHKVVAEPLQPVIEDAAFCLASAGVLPPEPWTAGTWGAWTGAVKTATGRKGRELFHPLRLALTGQEQGPEMTTLLPLIGRARAAKRLAGDRG